MRASAAAVPLSASRTSLALTSPFATRNSHWVPPSKSIPRLSPEIANAPIETTTSGARDQRPEPRTADEVEVRALVVDVAERPEEPTPPRDDRRGRAHAWTSGASRPAAIPTPRMRTRRGCRAMSDTTGCMKKYATRRSRIVDTPRKNAKPRTDPIARK